MKPIINFPHSRINTEGTALRDGISIEEQMRKAMAGNEPIQATAKVTYNDRKDGVLPQHDIRSDRFEIAMMATDRIHATKAAQRHAMDYPDVLHDDSGYQLPKDNEGKIIPQGEA